MTSTHPEAREARAAAAGAPVKRSYVQRIFSEIAPRYDLLNHLLSVGIDKAWRRAAIARLGWERHPTGWYLDLCAGTLDVGAALARRRGFKGHVVAADFAEPMLRAGAGKASRDVLAPVVADALALPVATDSCDGAIVAFGFRNVADLDAGFAEVLRLLAPGARFVILDLSTPRSVVVRTLYQLYFHHVLPLIGGIVSGHRTAYRYLPESVANFPETGALAARMSAAGFVNVEYRTLSFGIAAMHVGEKGTATAG
ncbi:MAG: ubiquinone/menaquinone biosynthesis methyltransferase [Gemmatimonadetes bacterium]|nr:ubiquinone/menaquinone biosynthesis methyltransferase [Gemmatimonadota bacterium]MBI3566670.1 ubiquinone/menaquinone biosynthesis methyltransferase [Gemmatimonadota bacterium]